MTKISSLQVGQFLKYLHQFTPNHLARSASCHVIALILFIYLMAIRHIQKCKTLLEYRISIQHRT